MEISHSELIGWLDGTKEALPADSLEAWLSGSNSSFSSGVLLEDCPKRSGLERVFRASLTSAFSTIRNNFISNFAGAAISVSGSSNRVNLLDNTITLSSGRHGIAGILVKGNDTISAVSDLGVYISDNSIYLYDGYMRAGILVGSSDEIATIPAETYVARNQIGADPVRGAYAFAMAISHAPGIKLDSNRIRCVSTLMRLKDPLILFAVRL